MREKLAWCEMSKGADMSGFRVVVVTPSVPHRRLALRIKPAKDFRSYMSNQIPSNDARLVP